MSLLSRLLTLALDRLLPTRRPRSLTPREDRIIEEASPLTHRDVERQQGQIRAATSHAYCELTDRTSCAICRHVPEEQRGFMSCLCQLMDERRRESRSPPTSPRAITTRPCIPPPRKR